VTGLAVGLHASILLLTVQFGWTHEIDVRLWEVAFRSWTPRCYFRTTRFRCGARSQPAFTRVCATSTSTGQRFS